MDLISRQSAIDIVSEYAEQFIGYIGSPNDSEVYAYARGLLLSIEMNINAVPSADAVPVVRCKDCKYMEYMSTCTKNGIRISRVPNDYCSRGVRKDE